MAQASKQASKYISNSILTRALFFPFITPLPGAPLNCMLYFGAQERLLATPHVSPSSLFTRVLSASTSHLLPIRFVWFRRLAHSLSHTHTLTQCPGPASTLPEPHTLTTDSVSLPSSLPPSPSSYFQNPSLSPSLLPLSCVYSLLVFFCVLCACFDPSPPL